ncbi:MAG: DNA-binding protein [Thermoprotei archaeon]|nr:MAG: DNA-binding protein [Thermoprotei archaeon]
MRSSISIFWRKKDSYYKVLLTRCKRCGRASFFARDVCPYCGSSDVSIVESSGRGRVVSYTVSYFRTDSNEEYLPLIIALVRLDEGVYVTGELRDVEPAEVREGMEVETVLRRYSSDDPYGLIYYGLKFIPVIKRG